MAAITLQRLKQIIADAYTAGYSGALDMNDTYVEEVIKDLLAAPEQIHSKNDGWKVYKVKDLRGTAPGTIFDHSNRGKGWIEASGTERYMRFHNGEICHFFSDESPWDEPMRAVGMTMKQPSTKPPVRRTNNPFGTHASGVAT